MFTIFNPNNRPVEELPTIFGFNNGGSRGFYHAYLISEDGIYLGSHVCSSEAYMLIDLGILAGHRADRHEHFRQHYPDGYRMNFVSYSDVKKHPKLMDAIKRVNEGAAATKK